MSLATLRLEHDPRPFADIEKRRRILLRHVRRVGRMTARNSKLTLEKVAELTETN
jgi:hypothetical protein